MLEKKAPNNYALFNKYLSKISKVTIDKFKSIDNIIIFLLELCECDHIGLAAKKVEQSTPFMFASNNMVGSDYNALEI